MTEGAVGASLASNSLIQAFFEEANIGMAAGDPSGIIIMANCEFCRIVGYPLEELLGMEFNDLNHPEDQPLEFQRVQELLSGEIPRFQIEKRYVQKQGHVLWVLMRVSLVRYSDRTPAFVIAQLQDITRLKQAEGHRRNLIDEFEQVLNEVRTLLGILPICSHCKRIRIEGGDPKDPPVWSLVEAYVDQQTEAEFSHSVCPECLREHYSGETREPTLGERHRN